MMESFLAIFAKWLNRYQKTDLIIQGTSLQKKQYEIKDQLLDFIVSNPELKILAKRNVFN